MCAAVLANHLATTFSRLNFSANFFVPLVIFNQNQFPFWTKLIENDTDFPFWLKFLEIIFLCV